MNRARIGSVTAMPEFAVLVFGFLLNLPWKFLQVPFFTEMPAAPHWDAIQVCIRATLGNAVMLLVAFAAAALQARTRSWILRPGIPQVTVYLAVGLLMTIVFERLATGPLPRWSYDPDLPIVPGLEVGLLRILQRLIISLLVVWFSRRHIRGALDTVDRD